MGFLGEIAQVGTALADWWLDRRDKKREEKRERDVAKAEELLQRSLKEIEAGVRWFEEFKPRWADLDRQRAEHLSRHRP